MESDFAAGPPGNRDPDFNEIRKTLTYLSQASKLKLKAKIVKCPNCNQLVAPKRKSRQEIVKTLTELEGKLQVNGRQLPSWVQAYKDGDSLQAAKILYLDYCEQRRKMVSEEENATAQAEVLIDQDRADLPESPDSGVAMEEIAQESK